MGEPLRAVMDRQQIPLRMLNPAHPDVQRMLARMIHAGVPIDGLALHFERGYLTAVYGDWLLEQVRWFVANGLALLMGSPEAWAQVGNRLVGKPLTAAGNVALLLPVFRDAAWYFPKGWIRWDTKLPQETYGRRALTEIAHRFALHDALWRYYEAHPDIREAHRRHPNNPEWERRNPERDIFRDWVVQIFKLVSPEEKKMFGWRPGDDWREVIRRRIEFLERYGGGKRAAEARDERQDA